MLRLALLICGLAAPVVAETCGVGDAPFPAIYSDRALFEDALSATVETIPPDAPVTGLIVPHHLDVPELIAGGLRLGTGKVPERIVVLFPDHFFRLGSGFAITTKGFETLLGPVPTDAKAAQHLADAAGIATTSCLFQEDHGLRGLLPFLARLYPGVPVLPVAIAINTRRPEWDAFAEALAPLLTDDTLVVQATDFSHYLPHHEARVRDQQVLNLIAARDLDAMARLVQPDHVDSLGALYLQMRLQAERYGAEPVVLASRNLQQDHEVFVAETTSYVVAAFVPPGTHVAPQPFDQGEVYMLGGDLFLGRAMPRLLSDPHVADAVTGAALAATGGHKLILNHEGVVLPHMPRHLEELVLAMPAEIVSDWAKRLNVVALGLANNHVNDIGPSGLAETRAHLDAAGIPYALDGETLHLSGVSLVALTDLDGNASPRTDRLTADDLDALVHTDATTPVVAYIHWGREYVTEPAAREHWLSAEMSARGAAAIVGAHSHRASPAPRAIHGGDTVVVDSLGNFLFDQLGADSDGALVELRTFAQGTVALRQMPLPQLFDFARSVR